eukprot:TRINITY_DN17052_c0_g1_i2.p1 TRINITY_DN17052_c0_g1~~TRINITY_DN17052_c0_g1_i2.p1  ORF type:complete len:598 (+),score=138.31 TRINITY_DN17052_c0_g1_i2:102-1796(+)
MAAADASSADLADEAELEELRLVVQAQERELRALRAQLAKPGPPRFGGAAKKKAGPPSALQAIGTGASDGVFRLVEGEEANGQPLWKHEGRSDYLFCGQSGQWFIGDEDERTSGFDSDTGILASRAAHGGKAWPHEVAEGGWLQYLEDEERWDDVPAAKFLCVSGDGSAGDAPEVSSAEEKLLVACEKGVNTVRELRERTTAAGLQLSEKIQGRHNLDLLHVHFMMWLRTVWVTQIQEFVTLQQAEADKHALADVEVRRHAVKLTAMSNRLAITSWVFMSWRTRCKLAGTKGFAAERRRIAADSLFRLRAEADLASETRALSVSFYSWLYQVQLWVRSRYAGKRAGATSQLAQKTYWNHILRRLLLRWKSASSALRVAKAELALKSQLVEADDGRAASIAGGRTSAAKFLYFMTRLPTDSLELWRAFGHWYSAYRFHKDIEAFSEREAAAREELASLSVQVMMLETKVGPLNHRPLEDMGRTLDEVEVTIGEDGEESGRLWVQLREMEGIVEKACIGIESLDVPPSARSVPVHESFIPGETAQAAAASGFVRSGKKPSPRSRRS